MKLHLGEEFNGADIIEALSKAASRYTDKHLEPGKRLYCKEAQKNSGHYQLSVDGLRLEGSTLTIYLSPEEKKHRRKYSFFGSKEEIWKMSSGTAFHIAEIDPEKSYTEIELEITRFYLYSRNHVYETSPKSLGLDGRRDLENFVKLFNQCLRGIAKKSDKEKEPENES